MRNNKHQPTTQHQKDHQDHQQNVQQQQQNQLKQGQSPKGLQDKPEYQEHEHPESRLTR
jgi:hypothetical protein